VTVAVAGLWELGWSAPLTEADTWRFMLRDFDVDHWYMAPVSGIADPAVEEYPSMEAVLDEWRGKYTVVFVDESAPVELAEFHHPENALYVFGKANGSPYDVNRCEVDLAVRISTPERKGLLWPHQAAAIVLYDRWRK
jgi:tRNA(Leu) C34 or U34 (ribose-2'-O)-methylase TrmL